MTDKIIDIFEKNSSWTSTFNNIGNMAENNSFFFIFEAFFKPRFTKCLARKSSQKYIILKLFQFDLKIF